jgi:hypothetical protein
MSADLNKRWADHVADSSDDEIAATLEPTITTPTEAAVSGKLLLGSSGTRAAAARPKRDIHATRITLSNLEAEISDSQVHRFLGGLSGDFSLRVLRGRGLAFIDVRGPPALVDKILALDGTKFGRRVVAVKVEAPVKVVKSKAPASSAAPKVSRATEAWGETVPELVAPVVAPERWAFVEAEKREPKPKKQPHAVAAEAEEAVDAAEALPLVKEEPRIVYVVETPAERKPLQLVPRTAAAKEFVFTGEVAPAALVVAPAVEEAVVEDKATDRLVRRKEAKASETAKKAETAKQTAKTKNRFAGLMGESSEESSEESSDE